MTRYVTLQPITITIFNNYGVYCFSKARKPKRIPYQEFVERHADSAISVRVCFDKNPEAETLVERSRKVTAYVIGLGIPYILLDE